MDQRSGGSKRLSRNTSDSRYSLVSIPVVCPHWRRAVHAICHRIMQRFIIIRCDRLSNLLLFGTTGVSQSASQVQLLFHIVTIIYMLKWSGHINRRPPPGSFSGSQPAGRSPRLPSLHSLLALVYVSSVSSRSHVRMQPGQLVEPRVRLVSAPLD